MRMYVDTPNLWQFTAMGLGGLVSSTVAIVVCMTLIVGKDFSEPCSNPFAAAQGYTGCLAPKDIVGIYIVIVAGMALPFAFGQCLLLASRWRFHGASLLLAAYMTGLAAWAMAFLCKPQATFSLGTAPDDSDPLQQLLGGMVFTLSTPLAVCAYWHAYTLYRRSQETKEQAEIVKFKRRARREKAARSSREVSVDAVVTASWMEDASTPLLDDALNRSNGGHLGENNAKNINGEVDPSMTDAAAAVPAAAAILHSRGVTVDIEPIRFALNMTRIFLLVLLFVAVFILACSLSPVWNYSANSYFPFQSPYSLANISVTGHFNFKLYLDVVVYFLFILFLIVLGAVGHFNVHLRRMLSLRLRVVPYSWVKSAERTTATREKLDSRSREQQEQQSSRRSGGSSSSVANKTGSEYNAQTFANATPRPDGCSSGENWRKLRSILVPFRHGISVGELIVLIAVLCLYGFWLYYWRWDYKRIVVEAYAPGPLAQHPQLQIWARVCAHMANLSLSFMLFPIAHNSLWESVFGIPFERALRYHRVLGFFGWLFVTIHACLWWLKWALEHTLWENVISIAYLRIDPQVIHFDNFTLLFAQMGWLLLTLAIIIAVFFRRSHYELFYHSHQLAAIFFFIVALLHAWTLWFYAIGGLLLWLFDRVHRLRLSSANVYRCLSVESFHGITRIEFSRSACEHHYPGEYVFLQIPGISWTEWHPFTISSSPGAKTRLLYVKTMGRYTFTDKMIQWAEEIGPPIGARSRSSTADLDEYSRKAESIDGATEGSAPRLKEKIVRQQQRREQGLSEERIDGVAMSDEVATVGAGKGMCCGVGASEPLSEADDLPVIALDGPYGRSTYYSHHRQLLLIGGGIGMTPLHSILADLIDRSQIMLDEESVVQERSSHVNQIEHVHVIWCARDENILSMFAPTFQRAVDLNETAGAPIRFTISLYATHGEIEAASMGGSAVDRATFSDVPPELGAHWLARVNRHRPDMSILFQQAQYAYADDTRDTMAMVCGPPGLVSAVSDSAFRFGFDFHSEVFLF